MKPYTLNTKQKEAIQYTNGPLLVLAGAGSGKTRVITEKIAWLIEVSGYNPRTLYAVTFTNKAANEMRERIAKRLPKESRRGLKISTFHTLGLHIIQNSLDHCHLGKGFSIFDTEDSRRLIKSLLPPMKAQDKSHVIGIQSIISQWKNDLLTPTDIQSLTSEIPAMIDAIRLFQSYEAHLKAYNAIDFDDLMRIPVHLLKTNAALKERWQNRIHYLLVDEYQDSNLAQYQLIQLLSGIRAQFTVVGDDAQSIYAFRGARPENLKHLQTDYPQLAVIKLEQNYRSSARILNAANILIGHNCDALKKALWSEHGPGEPIRVIACKDEQVEAEQVISDLITHKLRNNHPYQAYAILYRNNYQSRIFEKILRQQGIPYHLSGGQSFFNAPEIKDLFAYLKLLSNENDDPAFLRAITHPKRGIGKTSLTILQAYQKACSKSLFKCIDHVALKHQLSDKIITRLSNFKELIQRTKQRFETDHTIEPLKQLIEESGYKAYLFEQHASPAKAQKTLDNLFDLLAFVDRLLKQKTNPTLSQVINKLILIDMLEQSDDTHTDQIELSTVHAAKGLEFKHVYMTGMEEGLFPHHNSTTEESICEERRLAYVGITRAEKELCLTFAKHRKSNGQIQKTTHSRFLDEIKDVTVWQGQHEKNEEASQAIARSHLDFLKEHLTRG